MSRAPNPFANRCASAVRLGLWGAGALGAFNARAQSDPAVPYVISTPAGLPSGSADGLRAAAQFYFPEGVAADSLGNVYVADTGNSTIRKISAVGEVSTLAGTPQVAGSADGTGSAALFTSPQSVAVDLSGNVYVADTVNNTIRKITPAGAVTTLAGEAGLSGSADGTGSAARFNGPFGVAVDNSGTVYVADTGNETIRKITPSGVVTTLAGQTGVANFTDGNGVTALFYNPYGVAVDNSGNVYVADTGNQEIRKITAAGTVSTLAGSPQAAGSADGTGSSATFNTPIHLAVDPSGNVYVIDEGNDTVRKITAAGGVTTLAGGVGIRGSTDGTGNAARFDQPYDIAVDGSGEIYVADSANHTIRKVSPFGGVTTFAGTASPGSTDGTGSGARFNYPEAVALDSSGNVYIADADNDTIRKMTPNGTVTTLAGSPGLAGTADGTGSAARFSSPAGLAVDGMGNIFVADTLNSTVRKITAAGVVTTVAGIGGIVGSADGAGDFARFNYPYAVAVDPSDTLYVADTKNSTIRKITPAGIVSTLAGMAASPGTADGTGSAARFLQPFSLAVDPSGTVFVADTGNDMIRVITPAAAVTTLAGTAGVRGSADGTGLAARFSSPEGIALDSSGNIFVSDTGNQTLRRVSSAGVVTTLAGTVGRRGSDNGAGAAAQFNAPAGLAVDATGNLYVADLYNNAVRLGRAAVLTVPATARLVNLSVRSTAGTGSQTLIGGYVIGGSGTKSVLVRGDGPVLASFGVTGALADPNLTVFNSSDTALATNSAWGGTPGLSAAFQQVGAFSLPASSHDAAILTLLPAGAYTADISSTSGDSGVVLVEVYDADEGSPTARFINLSARSQAGTGSQTLIAGFVISGTGSETVLIRGDGPALAGFGVTGILATPQLTLIDGAQAVVATNVGWGNPSVRGPSAQGSVAAATSAVFTQVGAFQLPANSGDCALVATLPPGAYSVEIAGVNASTGVALVEVYEVPAP